jgi:hypothetical protein
MPLDSAAFGILQPGMVRADGVSFRGEIGRKFVHLLTRKTIDDARLVFVAINNLSYLLGRILFWEDFDKKILAVETGDKFVCGRKFERVAYILPDARGGSSRQRHADRFGKFLRHFYDLTVFGAKVVSPLGDAVRFVDGEQVHFQRGKKRENALG